MIVNTFQFVIELRFFTLRVYWSSTTERGERGVYIGGVLCHRSIIQGNPMQLHEILRYARTLPFQAEPDYDSLQVILRQPFYVLNQLLGLSCHAFVT